MTYDERNNQTLAQIHPSLRYKLIHLLDLLRLRGEDILLYDGTRTDAEQDGLWQIGRDQNGRVIGTTVTDARGGYSFHNYGLAVDFAPVGPLGLELSKRTKLEWAAKARYETIGSLARDIGLEWGGDWHKPDKPHLQYSDGLTIADLKQARRPDIIKSKTELITYYRQRIQNAERAMSNAGPRRQAEFQVYIIDLKEKILAL
jgi:peptidoglycan L-alanyl-D-glutamate endopeptidase CwlK